MKEPEDTPDPSGEPIAIEIIEVNQAKEAGILSSILGTMALGALGAFVLVAHTPKRLLGAANSARLNWEQRQDAIEEAVQRSPHLQPQPRKKP